MTSNQMAGVPATRPTWALPAALRERRPEATRCLDELNAIVWAGPDPQLLELARLRIAGLLGATAAGRTEAAERAGLTQERIDDLPAYPTSAAFSAQDRATLELVEQLVMDVSGVSPEQLDEVGRWVGPDRLRDVVTALWTVEFTLRLQVIAARLLPGPASTRDPARPAASPPVTVRAALDAFQAAAVRGTDLDAVTTEVVRLRCARTHHCRICQTLRLADARAEGVDEELTAKIDRFESTDLPDRLKVALRITDAFIVRPTELSDAVVAQARAMFGPDELAELCLDIVKWSTQKIHVALGLDGADRLETDEAGVALFGFGDDGTVAGYWTA